MDRKPRPLREWRISTMGEKVHYLGRVIAPDKEVAMDKAMEEFRIEPVRRFRLIAEPVDLRESRILPPSLTRKVHHPSGAEV